MRLPARCPVIEEAAELGFPARHLLYGKGRGVYRIIFHIREEEQHVRCCESGMHPATTSPPRTLKNNERWMHRVNRSCGPEYRSVEILRTTIEPYYNCP
jgi:hypothetical protein